MSLTAALCGSPRSAAPWNSTTPGGWVFVAEHAPPHRLGFAIGLLTGGLCAGIFAGSLVAVLFTLAFTPAQVAAGLWRAPFLLGGLFGFGAAFLRRWLRETPVFEQMRQASTLSRGLPLSVVLARYKSAVLLSMLYTWMLTTGIVVVILLTPTLLQTAFHVAPLAACLANLAGTAALCLSMVAVGMAYDRFGLRRVAIASLLLLIAGAYGLYYGPERAPAALTALYVLAGAGVGGTVLTQILMVRAFAPAIRFSGIAFSYNIAYAIFGGITPPLVAWLVHINRHSPAHYIAAVTAAALAAMLLFPNPAGAASTPPSIAGSKSAG